MPVTLQADLARRAESQNEIVFQETGLTVFAAPWDYAFCTKMDRMHKRSRRPYDIDDAVRYLHRYISLHGNRPVRVQDVRAWAQTYGVRAEDAIIAEINQHYVEHYGSQPIV
jgi:hypothetical protein